MHTQGVENSWGVDFEPKKILFNQNLEEKILAMNFHTCDSMRATNLGCELPDDQILRSVDLGRRRYFLDVWKKEFRYKNGVTISGRHFYKRFFCTTHLCSVLCANRLNNKTNTVFTLSATLCTQKKYRRS